ncbi:MAG: hypothetical protein ACIALR_02310, partial [Blastopirellula sp. JB062]
IDTGPILAHGFIEMTAADDEATLTVKAAEVAARLLPEILSSVASAQAVEGFIAESKGTLYRNQDRSWRHDFSYWRRRRTKTLQNQRASAHDVIYLNSAPASL